MFKKVVVTNLGAVAARVLRTLKGLGIKTVAVYSKADRELPCIGFADESYAIGAADPHASYFNQEVLFDVLKRSAADGLHPGYGFLLKNAGFAQRVNESGASFNGLSPR